MPDSTFRIHSSYGFGSYVIPPQGTRALVLAVGGRRVGGEGDRRPQNVQPFRRKRLGPLEVSI